MKLVDRLYKRIKGKTRQILRDSFGFFSPLGGQTLKAVEFALSRGVDGHYYEFGLYQGYTFSHAVKLSPSIHHFGFDSFEGMPKNNEGGGFEEGRFAYSYKKVINNLLNEEVFSYREHLIKGFFSDSLTPKLQNELIHYPASVILVDADLYESAVQVLEFIVPILQNGTLVIFDDWHSFDENSGEQKALREFLIAYPHITFNEVSEFTGRKIFSISLRNA